MVAWLAFGAHCEDKVEHWDEVAMNMPADVRRGARLDLLAADGGAELARHEKDADTLGLDAEPP